jgi:hypothetical protein
LEQTSCEWSSLRREERDNPIFIDLFYTALHLMEAFLAVKDIHVEDHKERVNYIGRLSELKRVN